LLELLLGVVGGPVLCARVVETRREQDSAGGPARQQRGSLQEQATTVERGHGSWLLQRVVISRGCRSSRVSRGSGDITVRRRSPAGPRRPACARRSAGSAPRRRTRTTWPGPAPARP